MSDFGVTPEVLANAAGSCVSTATEVQEELTSLGTYVSEMEASWGGMAATTFQELMQLYNTYSTMLYNALMDIGSGLNGTQVQYGDAERANLQAITNVENELAAAKLS
jgi:WXG100 family type VII secretion target